MSLVRRCAAASLALIVVAISMVVGATPAGAHTELSESDPANVSTVDRPVGAIRLTFSTAVEAVVEQFAIEDPNGDLVPITAVETEDDGSTLLVTPAHSLGGGRNRVSWAIRSGDSHTMDGTVSFTVTAPAGVIDPNARPIATAPTSATEPGSKSAGAERLATLFRWLVYAALLFCVGGLGYLSWVHRGTSSEGRWLVFLVRRAALVIAIGAVGEFLSQVVVFDGGSVAALLSPAAWAEVLTAGFGAGTVLRLLGAGLVLVFLRIDLDHGFVLDRTTDSDEAEDRDVAPGRGPSDAQVATRAAAQAPSLVRLRVEASPLAFVGAVLLVASEAFIGHTATTTPRLLVILSDVGHLVAGGLWAAGAVMLAATIRRRHRRDAPLDARLLATRFSVVAGWSLAAVAVTGAVLGWQILGDVSGLWSTTFGQVLLLKMAVVAVIACIGAYNHRVIVPALVNGGEHADHQFRQTVAVEAALFGVVLALTAVLVASSAV